MNRNQFSGSIPPELGNLFNLRDLDLSGHQFSGSIPSELGNLSNLTFLNLSNNQLSGTIPSELGNLSNLTSLTLSNNYLQGEIPDTFVNLTNLWNGSGLMMSYNCSLRSEDSDIQSLIIEKDASIDTYVEFLATQNNCNYNNSNIAYITPVIMYLLN